MKVKIIVAVVLIGAMVGVGWFVFNAKSVKAVTVQDATGTIASQSAQSSDHSTATVNNSIFNFAFYSSDKAKPIAAEAKARNPIPSPDRPKVVVAGASVTFVNYTDDIQNGLVKAGFNIPFVNIGGVNAKDLSVKWTIADNGNNITGLDKWLTFYLKQPNMVIQDIPSNGAVSIQYNPDIGAGGIGTLELTLDYEYANSITGEKYTGQYKGIVDYRTEKNNQPTVRLLTPKT